MSSTSCLALRNCCTRPRPRCSFAAKKTGRKLHAVATATDMYAAIDALVDKIDKQVRKHKEKLTDHHPEAVRSTRYS